MPRSSFLRWNIQNRLNWFLQKLSDDNNFDAMRKPTPVSYTKFGCGVKIKSI